MRPLLRPLVHRRLESKLAATLRHSPSSNVDALQHADETQTMLMQEMCIAVDEADRELGPVTKLNAHFGPSLTLHRAFSVFAFTSTGKLLLQRRSAEKITFPCLWTNACCSHPLWTPTERNGVEGVKAAAKRKMKQELGVEPLDSDEFLFMGKFLYRASMDQAPWGEHEVDYVFILRNFHASRISLNYNEVEEVIEVNADELRHLQGKDQFTPWFKMLEAAHHLQRWWRHLPKLTEPNHSSSSPIFRL